MSGTGNVPTKHFGVGFFVLFCFVLWVFFPKVIVSASVLEARRVSV